MRRLTTAMNCFQSRVVTTRSSISTLKRQSNIGVHRARTLDTDSASTIPSIAVRKRQGDGVGPTGGLNAISKYTAMILVSRNNAMIPLLLTTCPRKEVHGRTMGSTFVPRFSSSSRTTRNWRRISSRTRLARRSSIRGTCEAGVSYNLKFPPVPARCLRDIACTAFHELLHVNDTKTEICQGGCKYYRG